MKSVVSLAGVIGLGLLVTGCIMTEASFVPADSDNGRAVEPIGAMATPIPPTATVARLTMENNTNASRINAISELPSLTHQLEEGEYRWSQLLSRDSIAPIYEPRFVAADQAPYADDELVIGVEINGQAKAYAIGPLVSREMVNDTLGGIPVLVTW